MSSRNDAVRLDEESHSSDNSSSQRNTSGSGTVGLARGDSGGGGRSSRASNGGGDNSAVTTGGVVVGSSVEESSSRAGSVHVGSIGKDLEQSRQNSGTTSTSSIELGSANTKRLVGEEARGREVVVLVGGVELGDGDVEVIGNELEDVSVDISSAEMGSSQLASQVAMLE